MWDIVCDIASDISDPSTLLLKAVRSLPTEEQDVVLAWLLSGRNDPDPVPVTGLGRPPGGAQQDWLSPDNVTSMVAAQARFGAANLGDAQVVPVRFPVSQYERLKAWSASNGFPIAAVVRGLVERFLDDQPAQSA